MAKLSALLDTSSNLSSLSWIDGFPVGTTFEVQAKQADGGYTSVATVASAGGTGSTITWQRAATATTEYRVQASSGATSATLNTISGQSSIVITIPQSTPTVVVDQAEPVSDVRRLSISDTTTSYPQVGWYIDLGSIGTATGAGAPISWDTTKYSTGSHQVLARVQSSPDSYFDVRRTIQVNTNALALSLASFQSLTTASPVTLFVSATAPTGVKQMAATFDGAAIGTLTQPNYCSPACTGFTVVPPGRQNDTWQFSVPGNVVSGTHTYSFTAQDNAGNSRTLSGPITVSNKPMIAITNPLDGEIVFGTMSLSGMVTSDKLGTITTTARLTDLKFLDTTSTNFSGSVSISGTASGPYTLTVTSIDPSGESNSLARTIVAASSNTLAYQPVIRMGTDGGVLAADGDLVLYRDANDFVRLRNMVDLSEVVLAEARGSSAATWRLSQGHTFIIGTGTGCTVTCLFEWLPDGTRKNVEAFTAGNAPPVVKGNLVLYGNSLTNSLKIYNFVSGSSQNVPLPANSKILLAGQNKLPGYDLLLQGANIVVFYAASSAPNGIDSGNAVYKWESATNTISTIVSPKAYVFDTSPQTDGRIVTWYHTTRGSAQYSLFSQPVGGGEITTLLVSSKSHSEDIISKDGITAWTEAPTPTTRNLKMLYQGVLTTISQINNVVLYTTGNGYLVYGEGNDTLVWKASTGSRTLKLNVTPINPTIVGNVLYTYTGHGGLLYKIPLD